MIGDRIYNTAKEIFPIYRCLTGDGVRQTLNILEDKIQRDSSLIMQIKEIPSGAQVFDWTVPKEWKVKCAYIENEDHEHIIDIEQNNLHLVGYSVPIDKWVTREELMDYIYVQENQPEVIPYVTSYYKERFGFCMSKNQRDSLLPGNYHMVIESELFDGSLSYGEVVIQGKSEKEVFFSTYICHPSMANNECSGPALATELIHYVASMKGRKYTYRFLFIPETIGSIAYMATENHLQSMKENVIAGYCLTCVGDNNHYSMVHTRYRNTMAEKVLKSVLDCKPNFNEYSFLERGSDERQYNAPGIDLPIVTFCRTKFDDFPEYHTSADNMEFVSPEGFEGSYEVMMKCIQVIEANDYYVINTLCEPQLGRRGLYPTISYKHSADAVKNMMDVITYLDGNNNLLDLQSLLGIDIEEIIDIITKLKNKGLIRQKEWNDGENFKI